MYIKGQPPNIHYIKLNFHGYVKPHHQSATNFVIRVFQGIPILATSRKISYSDVLIVEAIALRQSIQQTNNQSFHQIQVERNSKLILDNILGIIPIPW